MTEDDSRRFEIWLRAFRSQAIAEGVDPAVADRVLAGASYDPDVIAKDRNQTEYTRPIWDYLDIAASEQRISDGQQMLAIHCDLFDQIEAHYGVAKQVIAAIWGLETSFGTNLGSHQVIDALATLACDGRRAALFEAQLHAALQIVQAGDVQPGDMIGSWAGAMGHTQFMPTSYLEHAVDFDEDGRRDIWGDDPTDALASTAAYLARSGWVKDQPWGVAVCLPEGFDFALARRDVTRLPSDWATLGIRDHADKAVPDHGAAAILLPAGARGVALMVFDNFGVIERYNRAEAYVIGVGHLSDRLVEGKPFQASWPRTDRALTRAERQELQQRLTEAGFDTQGIDGLIGPNTVDAVRRYQQARGLVPDGYPSLMLLERVRLSSAVIKSR